MSKLKLRRRRQRLQAAYASSLSLVESPSFVLHARPQDTGSMWPAIAGRCRRALPPELGWATPLLDEHDPLPVICSRAQAESLYRWLGGLANTERVSIGCERQRRRLADPDDSQHTQKGKPGWK